MPLNPEASLATTEQSKPAPIATRRRRSRTELDLNASAATPKLKTFEKSASPEITGVNRAVTEAQTVANAYARTWEAQLPELEDHMQGVFDQVANSLLGDIATVGEVA